MTRSHIYRRLFTPYVLILVIGLSGAWLAATHLFSETLEKRLESQLTHTVQILSNGVIPYTPPLIQQLATLIKADIVMVDEEGNISLTTLDLNRQQLQQSLSKIFLRNKISSIAIKQLKYGGMDYMLVWKTASQVRDKRVKYIAALSSLSDIQATNQRMAKWLWWGALLGLILLIWVGHRVSRSITLPIKELAHMASEIASGKRSVRAKIHLQDEIGELASALNSMAVKLADYEHEIAEQSRMATLGQMTARIAHEIRNPLTAIKMQLQLLIETADQLSKPVVESLLVETCRLEIIVLSTLQHKKTTQPKLFRIQLNELIEEIIHLQKLQFEHQGIQINADLQPALETVDIDRDMIIQIILNLLLNARDEMPEGGKIQLSTGYTEGSNEIWFAIDDSGPGIPQSDWKKIFTYSTSNKPGGFGLGLRLCRELVEAHHGTISVRHSKLGGARFCITLPLDPDKK